MNIVKKIAKIVVGVVLGYFVVGIPAYIVFGTDSLIPPILMLFGMLGGGIVAWRKW